MVRVLDTDGEIYMFEGELPRNLNRATIVSDKDKFLSLLKSGRDIRISVAPINSYHSEMAVFTVNTYGFEPMYEVLNDYTSQIKQKIISASNNLSK